MSIFKRDTYTENEYSHFKFLLTEPNASKSSNLIIQYMNYEFNKIFPREAIVRMWERHTTEENTKHKGDSKGKKQWNS